ncbi:hypothetical protein KEM48_013666 [Puccinia striiformis f. sp. tritici PST-130]|nr:hypothetical protein KEM48_013666 [Puccinia striiformis f. sp. tritici PST-130]
MFLEIVRVAEPYVTSRTLLMMLLIVGTKISNFALAPSAELVFLGLANMGLLCPGGYELPPTWFAVVMRRGFIEVVFVLRVLAEVPIARLTFVTTDYHRQRARTASFGTAEQVTGAGTPTKADGVKGDVASTGVHLSTGNPTAKNKSREAARYRAHFEAPPAPPFGIGSLWGQLCTQPKPGNVYPGFLTVCNLSEHDRL